MTGKDNCAYFAFIFSLLTRRSMERHCKINESLNENLQKVH